MISRFLRIPEPYVITSLLAAFFAGQVMERSAALGLTLTVVALAALAGAGRLLQLRRRYAACLRRAVKTVGRSKFSRPYFGEYAPELDAVAAALAHRHEPLIATSVEYHRIRRAIDALFSAFPGPCLLISAAGTVDRINEAVCNTFRITPEEAKGRPFLHVIRSHKIDDALRSSLVSQEGTVIEVDLRIAQPPLQFIVHIQPILGVQQYEGEDNDDRPPQVQGAVLFLHDVTRLRHLEQVRKEFVANVSHELRTPITSIKGFIETLHETDLPPEKRSRFLTIIKQEADRLHTLINELLDLALLESETASLRCDPVDVRALAQEVLDLLQPQAEEKQIKTRYIGPEDLPLVPANLTMLEQAFVSLVDNAIKYSPDGSTVTIEARRVAGEHVEVAVIDNGEGIPSEHIPRLFERFYRVDKARSKQIGGTGLGLALVRHIVQRHGGSVRAESRLGKGSRFVITLPLRDDDKRFMNWDQ